MTPPAPSSYLNTVLQQQQYHSHYHSTHPPPLPIFPAYFCHTQCNAYPLPQNQNTHSQSVCTPFICTVWFPSVQQCCINSPGDCAISGETIDTGWEDIISLEEVKLAVRLAKCGKAPRWDALPAEVLKNDTAIIFCTISLMFFLIMTLFLNVGHEVLWNLWQFL